MKMEVWVIFAKKDKIVAVDEGSVDFLSGDFFADTVLVTGLTAKRMGPRILMNLMNAKFRK